MTFYQRLFEKAKIGLTLATEKLMSIMLKIVVEIPTKRFKRYCHLYSLSRWHLKSIFYILLILYAGSDGLMNLFYSIIQERLNLPG